MIFVCSIPCIKGTLSFVHKPTNAHLCSCLTIYVFYSSHLHISVTSVTIFRVFHSLNTTSTTEITEMLNNSIRIRCATRIRHVVLSFVSSLPSLNFSTFSHKRHDFRKKSVLIFSASFIENVSRPKKKNKFENVFV